MKRLPILHRPYFAKKILEVGGGHDPYRGVTHAVDKYPTDNTQRGGNYQLPKGAQFFQGDLEALPFPADSFEFMYASHVFEHVRHPDRAASEIGRVSKRGYIETPSPLREQLACPIPYDARSDFHTLYCWSKDGVFHCIRKSERTIGQFPETREGRIARLLFKMRREEGIDLEPLLSRSVKTTRHFFSEGFRMREHADFAAAEASGAGAYDASVRALLRDISFLVSLRSPRFRRLRALLMKRLP